MILPFIKHKNESRIKTDIRIPVTIITGFLGSGKTSLINYLISNTQKVRFAIIENEFGSISIDPELIVSSSAGIYELKNGCICCNLNADLENILQTLQEKNHDFSHLLVETTGVADPSSVAASFVSDYMINRYYRLNSTICVVDTLNILDQLKEEEIVARQISFADIILLNKCDLAASGQIIKASDAISSINPFCKIHQTINGKYDSSELLTSEIYRPKLLEFKSNEHHRHGDITSESFEFNDSFDLMKFNQWMTTLLMFQDSRIYRVKGILSITGCKDKLILQSVRKNCLFSYGNPWGKKEERLSRIVFIGRDLDRKILEKRLKECIFKPAQ